jgi:hypothetical protein
MRLSNRVRVLGEIVRFARDTKSYWIVPLIAVLGVIGLLAFGGEWATVLIYTLF